ncbi:zinc knuckle CX2CX4HX4C containing protein [Tanacetum coccineum]
MLAYLKGQGASNANLSRANEGVAGTNNATHNNLPSRVLQNPNVSYESVTAAGDSTLSQTDSMVEGHNIGVSSYIGQAVPKPNTDPKLVEPVTKAIPTSFGEFSTMNPSSEPVVDIGENAWSFKHSGPTSNSIKSINNDDQTNPQTLDAPIIHEASIRVEPVSYVGAASSKQPTALKGESSNFKFIMVDNVIEGVALSMPRRVVENVINRFENTLYGYFIGKRLAFLVVEYFVKNNWSKYRLKRIMLNAKGFFFFKFDSRAGLESVLEGGPRMIKNNLIILKQWTMNTSLLKEELNRVPIWVKFHNVSLEGRSSFARCLIKVSSDEPLKDSFTIGIHVLHGLGFTKEYNTVEYEWKPLRCDMCKIFGHCSNMSSCPKRVVSAPAVVTNTSGVNNNNDGFQQVVNKKRNNKKSFAGNKIPKGVPVAKGFQVGKEFNYQHRANSTSANGGGTRGKDSSTAGLFEESNEGVSLSNKSTLNDRHKDKDVVDTGAMKMSNISSPNPFAVLGEDEEEEGLNRSPKQKEVRQVVNENNLSVCAILESHVDVATIYDTCKKVCSRWKWTSNGSLCSKGSRIILRWNDDLLMRGFLWCQGEMKKGKAKVAWNSICMPKHGGGLGIRIDDFNVALMATHIWSILTHKESLWGKWVHTYKLNGRSFWDVPCRGDVNVCSLKDMLSNRDIARSGFSLDDSVSNLIFDDVWRWPPDWLSRFPSMAQLHVPLLLDDMDDVILWRDRDGVWRSF